ncbi:MAG: thioredoxin domain-containing protein [Chloroflexi bacterium]|nr:thioredoxin domain-containing protein [Chloroflexota bacterium]
MAANYQDKGKVQIIYRHFAFIGGESFVAANASECAADQNKFWEYAGLVFKRQSGENKGQFSAANMKKWAADVPGLDTAAFGACVDSNRNDGIVRQDTAEGQRRGVTSTPSFFVNGKKYDIGGAQLPSLVDSLAR